LKVNKKINKLLEKSVK